MRAKRRDRAQNRADEQTPLEEPGTRVPVDIAGMLVHVEHQRDDHDQRDRQRVVVEEESAGRAEDQRAAAGRSVKIPPLIPKNAIERRSPRSAVRDCAAYAAPSA
jgi:hypothetical protein